MGGSSSNSDENSMNEANSATEEGEPQTGEGPQASDPISVVNADDDASKPLTTHTQSLNSSAVGGDAVDNTMAHDVLLTANNNDVRRIESDATNECEATGTIMKAAAKIPFDIAETTSSEREMPVDETVPEETFAADEMAGHESLSTPIVEHRKQIVTPTTTDVFTNLQLLSTDSLTVENQIELNESRTKDVSPIAASAMANVQPNQNLAAALSTVVKAEFQPFMANESADDPSDIKSAAPQVDLDIVDNERQDEISQTAESTDVGDFLFESNPEELAPVPSELGNLHISQDAQRTDQQVDTNAASPVKASVTVFFDSSPLDKFDDVHCIKADSQTTPDTTKSEHIKCSIEAEQADTDGSSVDCKALDIALTIESGPAARGPSLALQATSPVVADLKNVVQQENLKIIISADIVDSGIALSAAQTESSMIDDTATEPLSAEQETAAIVVVAAKQPLDLLAHETPVRRRSLRLSIDQSATDVPETPGLHLNAIAESGDHVDRVVIVQTPTRRGRSARNSIEQKLASASNTPSNNMPKVLRRGGAGLMGKGKLLGAVNSPLLNAVAESEVVRAGAEMLCCLSPRRRSVRKLTDTPATPQIDMGEISNTHIHNQYRIY